MKEEEKALWKQYKQNKTTLFLRIAEKIATIKWMIIIEHNMGTKHKMNLNLIKNYRIIFKKNLVSLNWIIINKE